MRKAIIGITLGLAICIALSLYLSFNPKRGEVKYDYGSIYYFSDGLVALGHRQSPHEIYLYQADIKDGDGFRFTKEGLNIHHGGVIFDRLGVWVSNGGINQIFRKPDPGRIWQCVQGTEGNIAWRQIKRDPKPIYDMIENKNWEASIRGVLDMKL